MIRDILNRYADGDTLLQLTDSQPHPINHKEIRTLNPDNHLYRDAWIAIAFQSSQGLITSTPAASNGLVLRVATIMPFAAAVAAMHPSAVTIAKSGLRAFVINPLNDTGFRGLAKRLRNYISIKYDHSRRTGSMTANSSWVNLAWRPASNQLDPAF